MYYLGGCKMSVVPPPRLYDIFEVLGLWHVLLHIINFVFGGIF
jgi:hypothetical protein